MAGRNWMVLTLFIYQMGACPCGCLAENYWYQTARRLVPALDLFAPVERVVNLASSDVDLGDDLSSHDLSSHRYRLQRTFQGGDDCDHRDHEPYAAGRRSELGSNTFRELAGPAWFFDASVMSISQPGAGSTLRRAALEIPTLGVRAHLQVFRL